jgi:ADP-ribose pyrophosphatase YjhB (NUDIX family)
MTGRPLYEVDPDAWAARLAEGNATQPRKRVSADALIRDPDGHVLIVEPTYKPGWDTPGGMSEANEPPHETVRRELREELGLDIEPGRLLVVDWVPPHGPWDDLLAFVFDGGTLTAEQAQGLRPDDDEVGGIRFCRPAELPERLPKRLERRITAALTVLHGESASRFLVDGRDAIDA